MSGNDLTLSDFDFWTTIRTRWRDMDSLNHINHTSYLTYMETARVELYTKLGFSGINKEMDESTILGSMEVHYLDQATHPTKFDVGHRFVRTGQKSYDLLSALFKSNNKKLVCHALFKLVSFNYKDNKTIEVPKIIRENCRPLNL